MPRRDRELMARMEARCSRLCSLDMITEAVGGLGKLFSGPDVPGPDPAIGQAAQANAAIGKEQLDFSKEQYGDLKAMREKYQPYIDKVLQQQLDVGDKNAAAADDYLNYMKGTFRPLEQGLAKDATDFDTEAKRAELAGKASSDVEQQAGLSDASARRDAARFGVNPGDAAFSENLAGSSLNKTIMKVGAMNQARTQARAEGRAFKFDVAGLGRGLPGAGTTASTVALNAGSAATGTAAVPGNMQRADASLMNTGFNSAVSANQSSGALGSNIFDARMRGYAADQAAQAGMWSGLGTLGGAGLAAMISSRGVKVHKTKVDHEKVLAKVVALPVEKWKYKKGVADEGKHIGTYAEDFKDTFGVGDGKTISVVDAIGVTMAAVKGLDQKVERMAARAARRGVAA